MPEITGQEEAKALTKATLDESLVMADILDTETSNTPNRTMLDVGAHHGSAFAPFLKRGWTVHAFEPDDVNRAYLVDRFAGNQDVFIDSRAVSDVDSERQTLYRSHVSSGITTLSPFHPSHIPIGTVNTVTLRTYCLQAGLTDVHFLKIDTEGYDLFVLQGFDWDRFRPVAVMCEFEDRKTIPLGYTYSELASHLAMLGYSIWLSEWYPVTEYGVQHTWKAIAPYRDAAPAEQSWGNLLAFDRLIEEEVMSSTVKRHAQRVEQ